MVEVRKEGEYRGRTFQSEVLICKCAYNYVCRKGISEVNVSPDTTPQGSQPSLVATTPLFR